MTPKAGFIKLFHQGLSTSQRMRAPAVDPGSEQGAALKDSWLGKKEGQRTFDFYLLPPEQGFSAFWTIAFLERLKI